MLCDWLDTTFVRYVLLIVVICAVILIASIVHVFSMLDAVGPSPQRRCLSTIYMLTMFVCICALLVFNNGMINRLGAQTHRVETVLDDEALTGNRMVWDTIQRSYECCGRHNASDWDNRLPASCCAEFSAYRMSLFGHGPNSEEGQLVYIVNGCTSEVAWPKGCVQALTEYVKNISKYISVTAFVFMCFAMVGIVASCTHDFGCTGVKNAVPIRQRVSASSV